MKTTRTKTIHKRINTGHLIVHLALLAGIVVVVFPLAMSQQTVDK